MCANTDVTDLDPTTYAGATLLDGVTNPGITDCPTTKWCDEGTATDGDANECPIGHYCEAGSMEPLPCEKGYYNDVVDQDVCVQCTSPNYCPFTKVAADYSTAVSQLTGCPVGHFCSIGQMEYPTPCAPGTYQPDPDQLECIDCLARYYCPYEGMSDLTNFPCPDQHSCEEGSTLPSLCEDTKWCSNAATGTGFDDATSDEYVSQSTAGGVNCPAG